MPAISKNWVAIADTAVDPDSPLDAALMTGIRDDLVHLREWLGAGYVAGAVQDHNHDGVNSAAIEIGPNWLRNGSFENDLAGWTATTYTGGTIAINTANETTGGKCLAITSTSTANGGGNVLSDEFIEVVAGQTRQFMMTLKATAAGVPMKAEVVWYDDAKAQVSATSLINVTTSPTSERLLIRRVAAPATAKYCKVRLELPTGGSATGTAYFDAASVGMPAMLGGIQTFTSTGTFSAVWGDVYVALQAGGGGGDAGTNNGGNGGTSSFGAALSATGGSGSIGFVGANGGVGTGGFSIPGSVGRSKDGGDSFLGVGGHPAAVNGVGYGSGGSGGPGADDYGGGAGGYVEGFATIFADTPVTIGIAGIAGVGGAGNGAPGVGIVRW